MSCVAELKAISHMMARLSWKKAGNCVVSATEASAAPMTNCIVTVHQRLVRNMSINGDQSGLMTHGRYSQLV